MKTNKKFQKVENKLVFNLFIKNYAPAYTIFIIRQMNHRTFYKVSLFLFLKI